MTDKFAGLSLGVDVSQVDAAVKSLDDLSRANSTAGKSFDNFIDAEQVAKQKMKEFNNEVKRQKKEFADVEKAIDPTIGKMRQLQKASVDLDNLWSKGLVPDAEFFNLSSMIETQINALNRSKMALTEEGRAAMANSKAKDAATKDADRFLKSLQEQANAATMTRTELLELKAAQLGVSTQAAPLIAAMNKQAVATNAAGLSAGEYKNAMRMLPAQITDVVTSLASGMPVWLVAVQQGGQIKDSFGGVGNTFKVLLSYLNPVTVGMTAMGLAMAAVAKAGYDSYSAISGMRNALIETGGYAASTAEELDAVARSIADTSDATIGSVRDIATELAKSGKYTKDQIREITRATAEWSTATGKSTKEIISDFAKITDDPIKGLAKLNEQYNFLEKGELTRIENIRKTVGETEAATEATRLFGDTMVERMNLIADSATPLEKMWTDIKNWASDAWGLVGDHTLGALNLIVDVVSGTVLQVKMILAKGDEYISNFIASAIKATQSIPGAGDFGKELLAEQESIAKQSRDNYEQMASELDAINARVEKGEMGYIDAMKKRQDIQKAYSDETKKSVKDEAKAIEDANKKKTSSAGKVNKGATEQLDKELYVLKAQLKVLQEHSQINDKISSQRRALWATEAQISILQDAQSKRKLTNEEKALLASQQKVLSLAKEKAELGDQIVKQEQINKLNDDSMKFIMQIDAASKSLNATRAMGTLEAERQIQLEKIRADYMSKGGGQDDEALKKMIDKQNEYYANEDEKRGDWLAGAQRAFEDYGESATDMYTNVGNIASNALNGLTDMMTEFLMTGQANFADFAKSIISQIIKMITQMVIFNSLSGIGVGSGKGFSFANSGWFATGGYTGDGGKYEPAGTVHKGEFVMTKEATKRIGVDNLYRMMRGYANGGMVGGTSSGGGSGAIMAGGVTIGSIPVSINNGSDPKGMEQGVKMIFKKMIQESCSQGGEVYNYINGKAGA